MIAQMSKRKKCSKSVHLETSCQCLDCSFATMKLSKNGLRTLILFNKNTGTLVLAFNGCTALNDYVVVFQKVDLLEFAVVAALKLRNSTFKANVAAESVSSSAFYGITAEYTVSSTLTESIAALNGSILASVTAPSLRT